MENKEYAPVIDPDLLTALVEARKLIKFWHRFPHNDDAAEEDWRIYDQLSPEMSRINKAILKLKELMANGYTRPTINVDEVLAQMPDGLKGNALIYRLTIQVQGTQWRAGYHSAFDNVWRVSVTANTLSDAIIALAAEVQSATSPPNSLTPFNYD